MAKGLIIAAAMLGCLISACGDSVQFYIASRYIDDQIGIFWVVHDSKVLQMSALSLAEQVRIGMINPDKIVGIFKTELDAKNAIPGGL